MEKIISEPIKEIWSRITGLPSPLTSLTKNMVNNLFGTSKPVTKPKSQQKDNFWKVAYSVGLGVFLFFAFELLIKPAIEQTTLYLWLKNLPTTCYFIFLTFSWPVKIAVGLCILIATVLALRTKTTQDEETKKAEAQEKNLNEQAKKQQLDDIQKLTHDGNKLYQAVQSLKLDLDNTKNKITKKQQKNRALLAQITQINQVRHLLNLPPLSTTISKSTQILLEQHNLSKLLVDKILENLNSHTHNPHACHNTVAPHIDTIKNAIRALSNPQSTTKMTQALDLLNLCYSISVDIRHHALIQAQQKCEAAKNKSIVSIIPGSNPALLFNELEKMLTHIRATAPSSTDNTCTAQLLPTRSPNTTTATETLSTPHTTNTGTLAVDADTPHPLSSDPANTSMFSTLERAPQQHSLARSPIPENPATFSQESRCTIC